MFPALLNAQPVLNPLSHCLPRPIREATEHGCLPLRVGHVIGTSGTKFLIFSREKGGRERGENEGLATFGL